MVESTTPALAAPTMPAICAERASALAQPTPPSVFSWREFSSFFS